MTRIPRRKFIQEIGAFGAACRIMQNIPSAFALPPVPPSPASALFEQIAPEATDTVLAGPSKPDDLTVLMSRGPVVPLRRNVRTGRNRGRASPKLTNRQVLPCGGKGGRATT